MLTVDVGNSKVSIGRWQDERVLLEELAAPEAAARRLAELAGETNVELALISVAPARLAALLEELPARLRARARLVERAPLRCRDPRLAASAGADRLANVLGLLPGPGLAVDCGTAVTVDLLDGSGTYAGGFIAPGPAVAARGVAAATALLPLLAGEPRPLRPGLSTDEALGAGLWGQAVGGVDRLVAAALETLSKEPRPRVVATGGWGAAWARDSLHPQIEIDPALTHRGIRRWAETNAQAGTG